MDYKALSNTGTWFIVKLQTERDKARLLDGLEESRLRLQIQLIARRWKDHVNGDRVFLMNECARGMTGNSKLGDVVLWSHSIEIKSKF